VIHSSKPNVVVFSELVEHPGGSDGGEFEQQHSYGVADDGSLYYQTDFPFCPTDDFANDEPSVFLAVTTREEALEKLKAELAAAEGHVAKLKDLVSSFDQEKPFVVYFGDEVYNDDLIEDDEEDEDDE